MRDLLLHAHAKRQLEQMAAQPKSAYIFHGPAGVGKFTAAKELARRLNCQGDAGGQCANCRLSAVGNFPDQKVIQPVKESIGIAQIQGLIHTLPLTRYYPPGRRMVIIDSAELMTEAAQNCLLKTLEEPPAQTTIILIADSTEALLPTILSRCQQLHFGLQPASIISRRLQQLRQAPANQADQVAKLSQGAVGLAIALLDDSELFEHYQSMQKVVEASVGLSLFQRLLLAAKLAEDEQEWHRLLRFLRSQLQADLRRAAREEPSLLDGIRRRAEALISTHAYLKANVSPRVALEGLMLEL